MGRGTFAKCERNLCYSIRPWRKLWFGRIGRRRRRSMRKTNIGVGIAVDISGD